MLLYHGIGAASQSGEAADARYAIAPEDFAKQLALLRYAGYHAITLRQFAAYLNRRPGQLPSCPILITFDDGLTSSWLSGDGVLAREGFTAVMFIDGGRVNRGAPGYLTWEQVRTMRASGRWEIQLHAWNGHRYIRYRPGPDGFGAFYAYRKEGESLTGWRERVFGDISEGRAELGRQLPGNPDVAFAPPYGNYGQEGTNDARIPHELLSWLRPRFPIVFVQSESPFAHPGAPEPLGRFQISRSTTGGELHSELTRG